MGKADSMRQRSLWARLSELWPGRMTGLSGFPEKKMGQSRMGKGWLNAPAEPVSPSVWTLIRQDDRLERLPWNANESVTNGKRVTCASGACEPVCLNSGQAGWPAWAASLKRKWVSREWEKGDSMRQRSLWARLSAGQAGWPVWAASLKRKWGSRKWEKDDSMRQRSLWAHLSELWPGRMTGLSGFPETQMSQSRMGKGWLNAQEEPVSPSVWTLARQDDRLEWLPWNANESVANGKRVTQCARGACEPVCLNSGQAEWLVWAASLKQKWVRCEWVKGVSTI